MVQDIVSNDDHEEETLQSDAETAKKVTINETHTLLSIVTTGKAQRFIQDTHVPLQVSVGQPQHYDQSNQHDHAQNTQHSKLKSENSKLSVDHTKHKTTAQKNAKV